jgi:predicted nucleic acid-binding protein
MICVDATVAAKWLFPEEFSEQALDLIETVASNQERVLAPHLLPVEVTNIIRQRMRLEKLTLEQGRVLLARFFAYPITLRSGPPLHDLALNLAAAHDLPATYDAHYVALAQQLKCNLWTDDRRLLRILDGKLPFVRWIGEYQAGEAS